MVSLDEVPKRVFRSKKSWYALALILGISGLSSAIYLKKMSSESKIEVGKKTNPKITLAEELTRDLQVLQEGKTQFASYLLQSKQHLESQINAPLSLEWLTWVGELKALNLQEQKDFDRFEFLFREISQKVNAFRNPASHKTAPTGSDFFSNVENFEKSIERNLDKYHTTASELKKIDDSAHFPVFTSFQRIWELKKKFLEGKQDSK